MFAWITRGWKKVAGITALEAQMASMRMELEATKKAMIANLGTTLTLVTDGMTLSKLDQIAGAKAQEYQDAAQAKREEIRHANEELGALNAKEAAVKALELAIV